MEKHNFNVTHTTWSAASRSRSYIRTYQPLLVCIHTHVYEHIYQYIYIYTYYNTFKPEMYIQMHVSVCACLILNLYKYCKSITLEMEANKSVLRGREINAWRWKSALSSLNSKWKILQKKKKIICGKGGIVCFDRHSKSACKFKWMRCWIFSLMLPSMTVTFSFYTFLHT